MDMLNAAVADAMKGTEIRQTDNLFRKQIST